MIETFEHSDGKPRCFWCASSAEYIRYHDEEWGRPVKDDQRLFEKLCLEGFQAGLSWITILNKRENFRQAFDNFNFHTVANYNHADVERLLQNTGIVRHKGKIEATINNAQKALELVEECGSLAHFIWQFEPQHTKERITTLIAKSEESTALSKALKKRGWKFVGPTTMYAFMQSMGMVNDHAIDCEHHQKCEQLRAQFVRP